MLLPWVGNAHPGDYSRDNAEAAPMYCHSSLQISLNQYGFAVIQPQMLLVETFPNYNNFEVQIINPALATDTVTCALVGMTLDVMVTNTSTGNSCWSEVLIEDKLKPVIECDTFILPCSVNPFNLPDSVKPTSMMDNCTDSADLNVTFSQTLASLDCMTSPYVIQVTRNYTVTDAAGNSSFCTQVVLIEVGSLSDVMVPADITLNCPATNTDVSVTGEPTIFGQPVNDFASTCMIVSTHTDMILPKCGNSSVIKRTFTITNWCTGMTIMPVQNIHIVDTTGPIVYCPPNMTINATANCLANFVIPTPNATDACADDTDIVFYYKVDGVATSQMVTGLALGPHIIEITAVDPCFNASSCTFTVTVVDNLAPTLTCTPFNISLNQMGMATLSYDQLIGVAYFDNCMIVDTMIRRVGSDCGNPADQIFGDTVKFCCSDVGQTVMVAIKVTDASMNMGVIMCAANVKSSTGPTLMCPPDMTIECTDLDSNFYFGAPTVTQGCPVTLDSITMMNIDDCGRGTITRTFTAIGASGGVIGVVDSCTQTITVINPYDFTNDSLMFPADITLTECNPDTSLSATGEPVILDNFCGNITLVYRDSIPSRSDACIVIYRIFDVFNACDSTAMFNDIQEITIKNANPPVITAPGNVNVQVGPNCDVRVDLPPVVLDDCSTDITVTNDYNNQGGDIDAIFIPGTYTIIFTATNACGLSSTDQTIVAVTDGTPPTIVCPPSVILDCPADTSIANTGTATAVDNCTNPPTITYSDAVTLGMCPNTYSIVRTWKATDAAGNMAECQQNIDVIDDTDPVISCPGNMTLNCPGDTSVAITGMATATEECNSPPTISYSDVVDPGLCPNTFTVTRTWSATDDCGNTSTCEQTIVVEDDTDPIINCPGNMTLNCPGDTMVSMTGMATATDECNANPVISYTSIVTPGACANTFTLERTWMATDACGNTSSCVQTITVIDDTDPIINCPGNMTLNCPADTSVVVTGMATATDECNSPPAVSYNDVVTPGTCANTFTLERTWTATDLCGNSSSCVQTITVVDNTDPIINCPGDVQLNCGDDTTPASTGTATATDECNADPVPTFTDNVINGNCPGDFTIERTWTATDACGNTASCIQLIVLEDNTAPVIVCPDDVTLDCPGDTSTANNGVATATDDCNNPPIITYSDVVTVGACPILFTVTRTWKATDACGNMASCDQVIIVKDDTAPTITCPDDVTLDCPADTMPSNTGIATGVDLCSTTAISYSDDVTPGLCPNTYSIVRTWTATDDCGNTIECNQNILVIDETDPVISCPGNVTLDCPADTSVSMTGVATATDECNTPPDVTYDDVVLPGTCPNTFTLERTWTATDACGNTSSCVQVITVKDDTDPIISCPDDVTLDCPADTSVSATGTATATDECNSPPAISYDDVVTPGMCANTFILERTWTATDACGNTSSCVQVITVEDNTDPMISCPSDLQLNCGDDTTPGSTGSATATDECNADPIPTFTDNVINGNCPGDFTIERTWTATDACGNTASCIQLIVLEDNTAPVIVCPDDVTLDCPGDTSTANNGVATATDDCNNPPDITYSDVVTVGACPIIFTVTRTWKATDACGNMASCDQVIVVEDNTAPIITCPADVTLDCPADTMPSNTGFATGVDLCSTTAISYSDDVTPGLCPNTYSIVRTWTATDDCGNTDNCNQNITVQDITDPIIMCPDDVTVMCNGDTTPTATGFPTATDECNNGSVVFSYSDVVTTGTGNVLLIIIRTWIATDACGNTASCEQEIIVVDGGAPIIICPDDITAYSTVDSCNIYVAIPEPMVTEDCGDFTVTNDGNGDDLLNASGIYPLGMTTITFTVEDESGNIDTCQTKVTVIDTISPLIDCPADMSVDCNDPISPLSLFGTPTFSDNCGVVNFITMDSIYNVDNCGSGTITRFFEVEDGSGNTASCSQTISITGVSMIDSTDFIYPPAIVEIYDCIEIEDVALPLPMLDSTINTCNEITVDSTITQIIPPTLGCTTYVIEYVITDSCNYDPATGDGQWVYIQTVGLFDTIAPVFDPMAPIVGPFYADSNGMVFVSLPPKTATDNCGTVTVVNSYTNGGVDASGIYSCGNTVVLFTATDNCGNQDTMSINVFVQDTVPPSFVCIKTEVKLDNTTCEYVLNANDAGIAYQFVDDNCTNGGELRISFSGTDPTDTIRVFDCSVAGQLVFLFVYAYDEQGNVDSCESEFGIDFDVNFCCGGPMPITIGGTVWTMDEEPVEAVEVYMARGRLMEMDMSNEIGLFTFDEAGSNQIHRLDAKKNDPYLNGVTAYDLSILFRHIAGIELLNDPYLYYAADVNGDRVVDIRDVLLMRKLLLGIEEGLPIPSWTFYDAAYDLTGVESPFHMNIPNYVMVYNDNSDRMHSDFIGVKTADLDLSAITNITNNATDKASVVLGSELRDHEGYRVIPVYAGAEDELKGGQIELKLTNNHQIVDVIMNNEIGLSQRDVNEALFDENIVRFVWVTQESEMELTQPICWIRIESDDVLNAASWSVSADFNNEVFNAQGLKQAVELTVVENEVDLDTDAGFVLYQNEPNPFYQSTIIKFNLPSDMIYELSIYDVQGVLVSSIENEGHQGMNQIEVGATLLKDHTGILYYQLKTQDNHAVRKMIIEK